MDEPTAVYQNFRCSICKRRLEKPLPLKCCHYACRHCLESKSPWVLICFQLLSVSYSSQSSRECSLLGLFQISRSISNWELLLSVSQSSRLTSSSVLSRCQSMWDMPAIHYCPIVSSLLERAMWCMCGKTRSYSSAEELQVEHECWTLQCRRKRDSSIDQEWIDRERIRRIHASSKHISSWRSH